MLPERSLSERGPQKGLVRRTLRRVQERLHLNRIVEHIYTDTDSTFTFIPSGREAITTAEQMIRGAKSYAIAQFYQIDMDSVGREFVENFRAKHTQSPQVALNFIVDNSIAWWNHNGSINRKTARTRKDETYKEVNQLVKDGVISGWVTNWFHILKTLRGSSNPIHRDHKKIVSADGEKALITSANVGEHHVKWGDIGVKIEGPIAKVVEEDQLHTIATAKSWERALRTRSLNEYLEKYGVTDGSLRDLFGSVLRNPSRRGRKIIIHSPTSETQIVTDSVPFFREATRAALGMVREAGKGDELHVGTPYPGLFNLTSKLMIASLLRKADVTLHIPHNNNYALYNPKVAPLPVRPLVGLGNTLWKGILKTSGVKIAEYNGNHESHGMNHAKFVSLKKNNGEQKVWIGSSNLSIGPVTGFNREIAAIIADKSFIGAFNGYLDNLTKRSIVQ